MPTGRRKTDRMLKSEWEGEPEKEEKRWRRSSGRNNACELKRGGERERRVGGGERLRDRGRESAQ